MDQKMIPMMVKQGYAAIAVTFDVWGLANLIHGGIQQARASVQQEEAEPEAAAVGGGVSNGADRTNDATNGTTHDLKVQSRSN
jgi:4-hydroxy-2-oxoheptanedioate aldolase